MNEQFSHKILITILKRIGTSKGKNQKLQTGNSNVQILKLLQANDKFGFNYIAE